jgi:uncharacterized membrane protein YedE/YeeE
MVTFAERCPWYVAGPAIGLIVVGLLWAANKPFGALGGYSELQAWLRRPAAGPGWRVFFLLGTLGGGLLAALAGGGLRPTLAYGGFDAVFGTSVAVKALVLAAAGLLIGYGARTARGCTSGHGVCGASMGSPASFVSTLTFMATAIASAHLLAWLLGAPR